MKDEKIMEIYGTLTKQETVWTSDEKILPRTLVFEALAPFPGYYLAPQQSVIPRYMYLVLNKEYSLTELLRATENVERRFDARFDAGKGLLRFRSGEYQVLRIRHLKDYNRLTGLQQLYCDSGILFKQRNKLRHEDQSFIDIEKFFELIEIGEGLFLDTREACHAYIEIPFYPSWDEFIHWTNRVKYNWEGSAFDAALGSFFYGGKLHSFVRVYSDKLTGSFLTALKDLYRQKEGKHFANSIL